jgi:hypothetical protein
MRRYLVLLLLMIAGGGLIGVPARTTDQREPDNEKLGRELLRKAIVARGGETFTSIRTLFTKGIFTPFQKGESQIPSPFENYIAYPDRERVDFGKGKKKDRRIQVNQGRTGWVYDGDAQTLKDQSEVQIADYLEGIEVDIDRILRADPNDPGRRISYSGRGELRPGERADIVSIEMEPGRRISIWLDRSTYLPISLTHEKSANGGLTRLESRFFQYVRYDGVLFPNITDTYRDGVQISRVNYQMISVGRAIDDRLFVKPAGIKEIR